MRGPLILASTLLMFILVILNEFVTSSYLLVVVHTSCEVVGG